MLTLLVAIISGGLVGGVVTAIFNRVSHWRALRRKLLREVSNMCVAYLIRFKQPNGRYWEHIVGNKPLDADRDFVEQRSHFIGELDEFTELEEARVLMKAILYNSFHKLPSGSTRKLDVYPEARAMRDCVNVLGKKLQKVAFSRNELSKLGFSQSELSKLEGNPTRTKEQ